MYIRSHWLKSYSHYPFFCLLVRVIFIRVDMAPSKKLLCKRIAKVTRLQEVNRIYAMKINARKRHLLEVLRGIVRREERAKVKDNGECKVTKGKRGRPERWPGKCTACCKRWLGERGGPEHATDKGVCAVTEAWLKRQKAI